MPEAAWLPEKKRLEIIQVLRFFAALSVVAVHLPTIGGGTWGVDIFFIISGFVIVYTATFDREYFFRKRLIRIVPIYWLMTLGVFAVALVSPRLMNNTAANVGDLLKSMFFIPFYKNGVSLQPLLYVGWTINCEMIFYAIFGIALAVSRKHTTAVASLLIAAMVAIGLALKDEGAIADFYGNLIFLEFPLGMALCHWWFASERRGETFRRASAAVCLVALLGWFVAYQLGFWETGLRVLDYGVPSLFFVGAALFTFREAKMPWLFVLLGDASYSLYLLHPFPVIASNKVLKLYDGPKLEDWLWSAAVTAACLAASVVMYKGFELPVQRFLRSRLLPPRSKPAVAPPLNSTASDEARS
ncbi:acyltransferase family protein [Lacipirellula sp.]|uniref:acyltransferase family protein n=1 Tax=Lacipirellula sp. TaxID=2691419 RepID=UPI003D0CE1E8